METKVCTYSEKNVRLQLLRIDDPFRSSMFEIRFNRKFVRSYAANDAIEARLYFSYLVSRILVSRELSDLTS